MENMNSIANMEEYSPCLKSTEEMVKIHDERTNISCVNFVQEKNPESCNVLLNNFGIELDSKIGIKQNDTIENYKQLIYYYYSRAEDLDNKYTILHGNLQEIKETLEKTELLKDQALKEKENMTIKFAKGERTMLLEKELKEKAKKKCEELYKEIEKLKLKIQIHTKEKTRISSMYDNKIHELKAIQSENNRIKNENCILKNELKLCQIALKNQAESNTKSQNIIKNLNTTIEKLSKAKTDEAKSPEILRVKLKEVEMETNEREYQLLDSQTTFKNANLNNHNSQKCGASLDSNDNEIKKTNLHNSVNISDNLNEILNQLEIKNKDLENDIQLFRVKESETLFFQQQLSEKNVELLSENFDLKNVIQKVTVEKNELNDKCKRLNNELTTSSQKFAVEKEIGYSEKQSILSELDSLKTNLAEEYRQNSKLKQQLHDQQGEFLIMRKKYEITMRELKKEIKLCKYNEGIYSNKIPSCLSTVSKSTELSNSSFDDIESENRSKQVLIEQIVSLQKISVLKSEKIDFLEDRIESLTLELSKKDTLLQYYFLQEQAELISPEMINAKFNICKLGGVMASIYNARIADENLTLKLLLEINCKLQAVLEDVLLKNIILKSNIQILGTEIEKFNRLKSE